MRVFVKLYGNLRRYLPPDGDGLELAVDPDTNVRGMLKKIGIPDSEVWVVSVNGQVVGQEHTLGPGDTVDVFAPVAGGRQTTGIRQVRG